MNVYLDRDGVEWAVTPSGMTRLFRRRTLWIRFTAWARRVWQAVRP